MVDSLVCGDEDCKVEESGRLIVVSDWMEHLSCGVVKERGEEQKSGLRRWIAVCMVKIARWIGINLKWKAFSGWGLGGSRKRWSG